jgi:chemotaxis protein MotA
MDIATIVGILVGVLLLGWAFVGASGGSLGIYYDLPSLIMVFGGAGASVMISFPLRNLLGMLGVVKKVVKTKAKNPVKLIADLVGYAEVARRDGILSLENLTREIDDAFIVKGIQMAVDGTDPELIEQIMNSELESLQERHAKGKGLMDAFGKYAPAYGMIGTLVGLVVMLKNLDDASKVGPGMAVALLTTLYGAVAANFLFLPLADKLGQRSAEEILLKTIVIKGVMSIQSGDNPRIVEQKLKTFLPPSMRGEADQEARAAA